MLLATLREVRRTCANTQFRLLSVFPEQDAVICRDADVVIVPTRPIALVCLYLPLSLLVWPFSRLAKVRAMLARVAYFRALLASEALLDHSGIAFVDGRGMALLAYNTACCLPSIALGIPVIKLSQALGPFRQPLNRAAAKFVLSRCARVFARGAETARHLDDLGLRGACQEPDVTFALAVDIEERARARTRLDEIGIGPRLLGIAPSRVMQRYCEAAGVDLVQCLLAAAQWAWEQGMDVLILAHSHGNEGSKNDDTPLCRALAKACGSRAALINDVESAIEARALIGCCHLFVGCRFHAVVGALAMGIPAVALGWSHKYAELLEQFGLASYAVDASEISADALTERLQAIDTNRNSVAEHVETTAARLSEGVRACYASILARAGA